MVGTRDESDRILRLAAHAASEPAPAALQRLERQLRRMSIELELTRRALEAIGPSIANERQRLARLEAAEAALCGERARLRALERAGPAFETMRARLRSLSPSIESARRALEATPSAMLPATRQHVRVLATEIDAVSRTLEAPESVLASLRARVQVLDALGPLIVDVRDEIARLERLSDSLEAARRELRVISADSDAALRAVQAVMRLYEN